LHRYAVAPLRSCAVTQLHRYAVAPLRSCTVTQLHRYTVVPLHSCTVTQLHRYTVAPLHSCTVTQLHRCAGCILTWITGRYSTLPHSSLTDEVFISYQLISCITHVPNSISVTSAAIQGDTVRYLLRARVTSTYKWNIYISFSIAIQSVTYSAAPMD